MVAGKRVTVEDSWEVSHSHVFLEGVTVSQNSSKTKPNKN